MINKLFFLDSRLDNTRSRVETHYNYIRFFPDPDTDTDILFLIKSDEMCYIYII